MSTSRNTGSVAADNTRLGITVLCLFGVAWTLVLIPLSSASTPVALTIMAIAVLWAGSLLLASRQRDFTPTEQTSADAAPLNAAQRQRVFVITNVAQAVVFSVVISICIATARVEWIPLFAALFVGLHFIPLAWAFAELSFGWAGAALTILGVLGLLLATVVTTSEVAVTVTAAGSALTLLVTATVLLQQQGRTGL